MYAYTMAMKRTTVIVDTDLLSEAAEALDTKKTSETIRKALSEIVRRKRLESLLEWDLNGMTLEDLREMRKGRDFDFDQRPSGNS